MIRFITLLFILGYLNIPLGCADTSDKSTDTQEIDVSETDADAPSPAAVVVETAAHTVHIEYHEQRGLWRRATVSLRMADADRPWRGALQGVSFNGLRPASPRAVTRAREAGYPLVGRLLSSGHQTGVRMYVPAAPETTEEKKAAKAAEKAETKEAEEKKETAPITNARRRHRRREINKRSIL